MGDRSEQHPMFAHPCKSCGRPVELKIWQNEKGDWFAERPTTIADGKMSTAPCECGDSTTMLLY